MLVQEFTEALLEGLQIIQPKVFHDDRGFFLESYRDTRYKDLGVELQFVQDNHSFSKKNTLRGMHFQSDPGQAKLVRVGSGKIYDVVVDIRKDSPTFLNWQGFYLDSIDHKQLFIPAGFAHGFLVISEEAHVMYKVSTPYNEKTERSFRYDDEDVGIKWPVENPILSERDKLAKSAKEVI